MMYNFVANGAWMARKKTGSRLRIGEPWASQLTALCSVLPGKPFEIGIIRDALDSYIPTLLADRDLRQRYENALKIQRGGSNGDNVVALTKK
jgi:hypothetical protein